MAPGVCGAADEGGAGSYHHAVTAADAAPFTISSLPTITSTTAPAATFTPSNPTAARIPPPPLTDAALADPRAKQAKVVPVPITTMSPPPSPPGSPKPARPHVSPPPSPPPQPDDAQTTHGGRSTPYAQTFAPQDTQAKTDPYARAAASRPATGKDKNAGAGGGARVREKADPDPASARHRSWTGKTDFGADQRARAANSCCHSPLVWGPMPSVAHHATFNHRPYVAPRANEFIGCAGCPTCGLHH